MKPSDFKKNPYDSVFQNSECETIARNIMVILSRTGDKFRDFCWAEYVLEREKDGNFSTIEKQYLDKVIGYCQPEETAKLFIPAWR